MKRHYITATIAVAATLAVPAVSSAAPAKCEAAARNGIQAVLDSPVCSGAAPDSTPRSQVPKVKPGPSGAGVVGTADLVPDDDDNGGYHLEFNWKPNPNKVR